jgi:hypothetical protein
MSAKTKLNRNALDVARFVGGPSYDLAVVVHRETEAQRGIDALAFRAQHGDRPQPTNPLVALVTTEPYDRSAYKSWDDYAKNFDVLLRCSESLGGSLGDVAKRIALELQPENSEALFWMATWLQALDHADDLKSQMAEQNEAIERAKSERRKAAVDAANASHAPHAAAREYVVSEWALHKGKFGGNRTKFATQYVEVILSEFKLTVAARTIHATWLKGL